MTSVTGSMSTVTGGEVFDPFVKILGPDVTVGVSLFLMNDYLPD
jgi:energy-converting hydrogenase Eha subunit E